MSPQEKVEAALQAGPVTNVMLEQMLPDESPDMIKHYIKVLRRAGKLRVSGWVKNHHQKWCAVYAAGPGADEPRPCMTVEEIRAKGRETARRKRAAKAEARREAKQLPDQILKGEGLPIQRVLSKAEAAKRAAKAPPLMRLGV